MKVILAAKSVYPFHPYGGVQKYVYNYAKFMANSGVEVEIVTPLDKGKRRSVIYEGIKYTLLPPAIHWFLDYPIGWLGIHIFSCNLAKYLKGISFDLLHTFDITGYQYLKLACRKPVVSHIFSDNYLCNRISFWDLSNILSFFGGKSSNIKKPKVKFSPFTGKTQILKFPLQYFFKIKPIHYCLVHSDALFFELDFFLSEVTKLFHIDKNKCTVVPVGIDTNTIKDILKRNVITRGALGFKDTDLVLITVNRLAADKGVDEIILSLEEIKKELPNIKLIIIGSGYQEQELLRLIKDRNLNSCVRHFKEVSEEQLYAFYKLGNIFISAFSYLGSSISTLEAMACGLPIITTAQPWLVVNKQNGDILANNELKSIAKSVICLAKEGRLAEKGQASYDIAKSYDWLNIVKLAKTKYEHIISASASKITAI